MRRTLSKASSVHLDALRGLAALSVFCAHSGQMFPCLETPHGILSTFFACIFVLAHEWVMVFFVLSGYFVGGSVLRARRENRWQWKDYLIRRLTRLYLVLLPALFLGGFMDRLGIYFWGHGAAYPGTSWFHFAATDIRPNLTFPVVLANLFFQQHLRIPLLGSNGPLWSLSNEFWYYLLFPALLALFHRDTKPYQKVILVGCLGLWCWYVRLANVVLFIPWLMGAALEITPAWRPKTERMRRCVFLASVLQFMVVMAVVAMYLVNGSPLSFFFRYNFRSIPISYLAVTISAAMMIWSILQTAREEGPVLYQRIAKRLAASSYSLYLLHAPAIVFLCMACRLPSDHSNHVLMGIGVMALVWIYAQCIYECFEKHTEQVRKWIVRRIDLSKKVNVAG